MTRQPTPGVFYIHEALHMTDYFTRAIQRELAEHPAIKDNPEMLAHCEAAGEALGRLYQALGNARARAANP